jgi:hypothetical protein
VSYEIDTQTRSVPLASKVFGAAAAEDQARGQVDLLVWMDADSIVLQEPDGLILDAQYDFGYRPVDHTLIGSRVAQPVDAFWATVYEQCGVPAEALFTMTTTVDRERIRPYFNAGLLVVRPARLLLRRWRDTLVRMLSSGRFDEFYDRSMLYRVFIHQAALAGAILASVGTGEMMQLSPRYGYPLHMHDQHPVNRRIANLGAAVTCRYDEFFEDPDWHNRIEIDRSLLDWIKAHLDSGRVAARRSGDGAGEVD